MRSVPARRSSLLGNKCSGEVDDFGSRACVFNDGRPFRPAWRRTYGDGRADADPYHIDNSAL